MKSILSVSLVIFAATLSINSVAKNNSKHGHAHKDGTLCEFAPKNDLFIPAGMESLQNGGITEKEFNDTITRIEKVYAPIVKKAGGTLQMKRLWSDGTVNASAMQPGMGSTWIVNMYGGLARHPVVTVDGFALVVCHELGHHLAGFPKVPGLGRSWASNEGQSDYFATMKCFRRVFENDDNASIVSQLNVPAEVRKGCSVQFKSSKEINLCIRGAMGGKVLATLLWDLSNSSRSQKDPMPEFNTPDTSRVSSTNNNHPKAQCRLDTYLAGAVCGVHYSEDFAKDNAIGGACATEKGDTFGVRSQCWYKPSNVPAPSRRRLANTMFL